MRRTAPLALLLVVGLASPAAASFLGSVIRLEVAHPTTSTLISTPTTATVVTPGVEFPDVSDFQLPGTPVVQTAIDISGTSITIDFDNVTYSSFAFAQFNGYILTDANGTLPDFAAATIDSSLTTLALTPGRVTVTANQIFINVSGLTFNTATFAKIDVTFGSTPQPSAPSNLQATVAGNLLTLGWAPPTTPPSGYLIEAGTAPGLADLASVPVAANPPGITAPVPNGTYFIRVRAIYPGGPGSPSNEVVVTIGCTGPPAAPAGFGVTQGAGGNPIHFAWAAPSAAVTAYRLEAGSGPGLANLATVNLAGSATVFDVQAPPGSYFVRLRALNACGTSAPSQEVVVTVGSGCVAPSAPQNLVASVSGQTVTLGWTPPATGTAPISYTLLAGSTSGASNIATVPMGGATSIQAPVPNGTYFVRVAAANACGVSGPSNEAVAQVGGSAGAPQLTFTITPNPVPYTYFGLGCAGTQVPGKTWVYNLQMTNQGTAPFDISSFSGRVTAPGLPTPVDIPYTRNDFILAFGGSTIAPQASLQGPLCVVGNWEDATLQWTYNHVGGGSFTTPVIKFLRP